MATNMRMREAQYSQYSCSRKFLAAMGDGRKQMAAVVMCIALFAVMNVVQRSLWIGETHEHFLDLELNTRL
jgi:hypothetical protein